MLKRIKKIFSYIRGDFIVVDVDAVSQKLTVDAGNNSAEELKKVANTLFKSAHKLSA